MTVIVCRSAVQTRRSCHWKYARPLDCLRLGCIEMNGDEMEDIIRTFRSIDYTNKKPHLLISHTTKGKGVSYMEGIAKWHHGVPTAEQYEEAVREVSERIEKLEKENNGK